MSLAAVLLPVFVQIGLTIGLLIWLGAVRIRALRERRLVVADMALGERNWPAPVTRIQNAYENQFELPVLFYVLVVLALVSGHTTAILVALSWVFVVSRIVHAFIHATTNDVPRRFWAYCVGLLALMILWAFFAFAVVGGR
jgi:hypothetical protein